MTTSIIRRPTKGRPREGRQKICVELTQQTRNQFRSLSEKTGLPQYEILERVFQSISENDLISILG